MSLNAKFATVRGKLIFMGFYAHGNTVPTPLDPDDGYAYGRSECQYVFCPYSNRAPAPGFVPGQAEPPAQSDLQPGPLYNWPGGWAINDLTGLVTLYTTYWQNGNEVVNNDGIIKVYAICLRMSVTTRPGAPAPQQPTEPTPTSPTPAPPTTPTAPAGNVVATVALTAQTAALGSASSPAALYTVGASETTYETSYALEVGVPSIAVLNAQGNPACAVLTLVLVYTLWGGQPWSLSIAVSNYAGAAMPSIKTDLTSFIPEPYTAVSYYTIWTVDGAIAAGSSYGLSITLQQVG